jgi:Flp pilus assembly CpaF family ATPase
MRPDRLIVGEVRRDEALDMLQALNTGHDGSLTTVHANDPDEVVSRLETMVLQSGVRYPLRAIRQQIVGALHIVVHVARAPDGRRSVESIAELGALTPEDGVPIRYLFRRDGSGQLRYVAAPRFDRRLSPALRPLLEAALPSRPIARARHPAAPSAP